MIMAPPVSSGGRFNSGEVGFGGPWVSAVLALVLCLMEEGVRGQTTTFISGWMVRTTGMSSVGMSSMSWVINVSSSVRISL